jgi:hypothetical protein
MKLKFDLLKIIGCWLMLVFVSSCKQNPEPEPVPEPEQGVYILNQGGQGANDASLWAYNPSSGEKSVIISSIAANSLGDVAQAIAEVSRAAALMAYAFS